MVETSGMLKGGSSAFQRPYSFCFNFNMVSNKFRQIVQDMSPTPLPPVAHGMVRTGCAVKGPLPPSVA